MLKQCEDILKEMKRGGGMIVQCSGKGLRVEKGGSVAVTERGWWDRRG